MPTPLGITALSTCFNRVPLSDIMIRKSTLPGHGGVPPASIKDPQCTELADFETGFNSHGDGASINVPSDRSHRYALVDKAPNFTVSSTLTETSRDFSDTCDYSQPQGDSQHSSCGTTPSDPFSCFFLRCEFKWTSPSQYRTHFKKWHSDDNVDNVLGKPARPRRKPTMVGSNLPQHSPPPAIEPDRLSQDEPLQPPLTLSLSAVATFPSRMHEYSRVLEYSDAPDAPSAFSSTEERAQSVDDMGRQFRFAHPFW
jgi:hypothetical protein